jgi:hypothetical protein
MASFDFELPTDLLATIDIALDGSRLSKDRSEDCRQFTTFLADIAAFPTLDDEFLLTEGRLAELTELYQFTRRSCEALEDPQIAELRQAALLAEEEEEACWDILRRVLDIPDSGGADRSPSEIVDDLCREAAVLDFLASL